MPTEVDQTLLQRFVDGDRTAFETLFREFEHDVYRWILSIVRDESLARDGVVEAFWRCYRSRARFDPSRSFGAWMRRIATRVSVDLLKGLRRYRAVHAAETETTAFECLGSEAQADQRAQSEAVELAFNRLPPKLRVIATLALIEQRTHKEIADGLGVPIGTVKSRLFRARRKLIGDLERLGVKI